MNRSLRVRLLLATSLSSALVLSLLGLGIYLAMTHLLVTAYDASLLAKARALAAMVEENRGRVGIEFDVGQMAEFSSQGQSEYFQVWQDEGQVVCRSDSLAGRDLPVDLRAAGATPATLALPGSIRAVVMTFTPRSEGEHEGAETSPVRTCTIAVAGTPVHAQRMLGYLGWLLVVGCGTAILLSGLLLLRAVGRSLRPVTEVAHRIEQVRESDLTYRLPRTDVPGELVPVVDKLNGLLDRLELAFAREQAFTADVAHELRTPLAGLLATIEVCRSRPRSARDYEAALDSCRSMTDCMQGMVENLLLLARVDAGQLHVERRRVDLAGLLAESWSLFGERAAARRLQVRLQAEGAGDVHTDPDKLRIVVHNLFDNAVSHSGLDGKVRIGATRSNGEVLVEVANSDSQVAAEDVPHLFERFWRGDRARTDTGLHCGLGLSLSQRLVGLLDGKIAVETTCGGEFKVRLSLPVA